MVTSSSNCNCNCMVVECGQPGNPRVCPGDGRYHHHGMIHTRPDTALDLGSWDWLCDEHFAVAKREWAEGREP